MTVSELLEHIDCYWKPEGLCFATIYDNEDESFVVECDTIYDVLMAVEGHFEIWAADYMTALIEDYNLKPLECLDGDWEAYYFWCKENEEVLKEKHKDFLDVINILDNPDELSW